MNSFEIRKVANGYYVMPCVDRSRMQPVGAEGASEVNILAIDPGTTESGWTILQSGIVHSSGVLPNAQLLSWLWDSRFAAFPATELAIEMVASYGMPVGREVFETCVWIGRFQQAWHSPESVRLVYRRDVKLHLCGSARAKDPNVWQALLDKFGGESAVGKKAKPGPLYGVKSHARAALAVAVTVADLQGQRVAE